MSDKLKVGYARVTINPPLGIPISGYFIDRHAKGFLDDLEAVCIAVSSGGNTALMITLDNLGMSKDYITPWRNMISDKTGIPADAIFIHSTHTHQAPLLSKGKSNSSLSDNLSDSDIQLINQYADLLEVKLCEVSAAALADLTPARMGIRVGEAKNIAFVRRFRMTDGSVRTNPGVNNPDIVAPIGDVDERVNVVRFDREGATTVVLANFGNHPDVIGGELISADWPAMTRRMVEKCIDNTSCIFFNGAQGDVNHINVHPNPGDDNDMEMQFDCCARGYGHVRHMARVMTGAIMSVYDKVEWLENTRVRFVQKEVDFPANKADPKDLPLAHKYNDLHLSGRDDLIPYEGMMLTTVVAEAGRMVRLENAPDNFPLLFSAVAIGDVAFFGLPGEPFTAIGRGIKEAEGWKLVLPCCSTNTRDGYFPMIDSYNEGGYEARSSPFKAGVGERIIKVALEILNELR